MHAGCIIFDPHRRAESSKLKAAVSTIISYLESREIDLRLRRRVRRFVDRQRYMLAVEVIICNFAWIYSLGLSLPLAVPRSSRIMWSNSRYALPVYGQHFLDVLDLLTHPAVRLAESISTGFRYVDGRSGRTLIQATSSLFDFLPPIRAGGCRRAAEPEVLILKGRKDPRTGRADLIDYRDTATTRRRRRAVKSINRYLRAAHFRLLDAEGGEPAWSDAGQPLDCTRRAVRRIFNNGSWFEGGRLFDGFWEGMRRDDRVRLLRIGTAACPPGERIANVDFGQLFPTLAYLELSLQVPEGDLYDIVGDGTSREGWKRLLNSALFTEGQSSHWPAGTLKLFPRGTKLQDAFRAIRSRHQPIAHLLGTRLGYKLMLIESEILIETILRLNALNITALPLHDSVLVGVSDAETARDVMAAVFASFTNNARAQIKIDFGLQSQ